MEKAEKFGQPNRPAIFIDYLARLIWEVECCQDEYQMQSSLALFADLRGNSEEISIYGVKSIEFAKSKTTKKILHLTTVHRELNLNNNVYSDLNNRILFNQSSGLLIPLITCLATLRVDLGSLAAVVTKKRLYVSQIHTVF